MSRKKKNNNIVRLRAKGKKAAVAALHEAYANKLKEIYKNHPDKKQFSKIGRAVRITKDEGEAHIYADVEVLIEMINKKE